MQVCDQPKVYCITNDNIIECQVTEIQPHYTIMGSSVDSDIEKEIESRHLTDEQKGCCLFPMELFETNDYPSSWVYSQRVLERLLKSANYLHPIAIYFLSQVYRDEQYENFGIYSNQFLSQDRSYPPFIYGMLAKFMGNKNKAQVLLSDYADGDSLLRFHYASVLEAEDQLVILNEIKDEFAHAYYARIPLLGDTIEQQTSLNMALERKDPATLVHYFMEASLTSSYTLHVSYLLDAFFAGSVKAGTLLLGYELVTREEFESLYGPLASPENFEEDINSLLRKILD